MVRKKTSVILQCALREYDAEQNALVWELRDLDALAGELRLKSIAYERLLMQELDPSSGAWAAACHALKEVNHKLDALREFRKTLEAAIASRADETEVEPDAGDAPGDTPGDTDPAPDTQHAEAEVPDA